MGDILTSGCWYGLLCGDFWLLWDGYKLVAEKSLRSVTEELFETLTPPPTWRDLERARFRSESVVPEIS